MTEPPTIYDRDRTATLWLLNGGFMEIPEESWSDLWDGARHHHDGLVALKLKELTGLKVTVRTVMQTTTR
jgi:hypothetical protein